METFDWQNFEDKKNKKWKAKIVIPHTDGIFALKAAKHEGKEFLVSGSFDSFLKVWEIDDEKKLKLFAKGEHEKAQIRSMIILEKYNLVFTGDSQGFIRCWSWPHCKLIQKYSVHQGIIIFFQMK